MAILRTFEVNRHLVYLILRPEILYVIFIFSLFNDDVSGSDYILFNDRTINE